MLQFYDRVKFTTLLAIAAAGGAVFASSAIAATGCDVSNGYDAELTAFVAEASTCIGESERIRADLTSGVIDLINSERADAGMEPLQRRNTLDQAAAAHALDMSSRHYASHSDKEGRDHIYRVRAFDRSLLIGATGANIIISPPGADAASIYQTLSQDDLNAENFVRDGFTHMGMAVVEHGEQFVVVQVFVAVEGELNNDLPLQVAQNTPVRATLSDSSREVLAWGLTDQASGDVLARGKSMRVRSAFLDGSNAAELDFVVSDQQSTYILKGPMITAQ